MKLRRDESVGVIVAEHRDQLMRFGYEYVEAALTAQGRKLIVTGQSKDKDGDGQEVEGVVEAFQQLSRTNQPQLPGRGCDPNLVLQRAERPRIVYRAQLCPLSRRQTSRRRELHDSRNDLSG